MKMRKNLTAILLAVLAISSLCIAVAYANTDASVANTDISIQKRWVCLAGKITQWGSTPVNGTISVQARVTSVNDNLARKFVAVSAVWTNGTAKPRGNFTYTFYAAKLVNLNMTRINYQGNNFYLNGTWAVSNVTVTNTVITNDGVTSVHRETNAIFTKAVGQLNVTDKWTKFTLSINGIDPLTGSVRRYVWRTVEMNICKVSDDGKPQVTIRDFQIVARAYGAMPGMNGYDQKLDFNLHYKIDITNLATVAANVQ
jgi:hypothetical protein